ncbi:hypothetical protein PG994_001399 [Apiospora phragmitis]|uniref:Myb-like DNA-binding domain-containing protein n=1 Tax=Apiospora phragmitis TaxID=2905665 RepID=A0ABR1WTD0_9PEZI
MAPPQDTESQFRFLIACIKHSTNGKVDFEAVRKECDVVTKGAAAKRFERLMKAHGINGGLTSTFKKETKEEADEADLPGINDDVGDDDEPIKGEVKSEDAIHVKSELGGYANLPMMSPPPPSSTMAVGAHVSGSDSDDDVMIVCASEKTPDIGDGSKQQQRHREHSRQLSPAPAIVATTKRPGMTDDSIKAESSVADDKDGDETSV